MHIVRLVPGQPRAVGLETPEFRCFVGGMPFAHKVILVDHYVQVVDTADHRGHSGQQQKAI
jgi:hypothetical protein